MKNLKKIIIIVIIAGLAYWAYGFFKSGNKAAANQKPAILVSVETASLRDVPLELRAVGTVVTYQTVAVKSRIDSQLMEVKFSDGDSVKKGDLLFVLDDRAIKAQIAELEANTARDKAQLQNLLQQYNRNKELAKKGFASASELDDSKAAYDAQRATVNASVAASQNLKVQLQYTKITSPITGRTGTINVTVGNNIKANDTAALVTINQVKPIRVQVSLPQRYLDVVREATAKGEVAVQAMKEGSAKPSGGIMEYIDNNVDSQTGTFAARASFDNEDEALWPGMFVNLLLNLGSEKSRLTVPEVAVQHGQEGDFVFIVENDKAFKKPVKVERIQDSLAIITEGINNGDIVVVDGLMSLSDNAAVKIQPNTQEKK